MLKAQADGIGGFFCENIHGKCRNFVFFKHLPRINVNVTQYLRNVIVLRVTFVDLDLCKQANCSAIFSNFSCAKMIFLDFTSISIYATTVRYVGKFKFCNG